MYHIEMKKLVDKLQINPKREYSIMEIANLELIPWAKNYRTLVKILKGGDMGWDIKNSKIHFGTQYQTYSVSGKDLIKYIINNGQALISTVRKTKNGKQNSRESKNRITSKSQ